MTHAVNPLARRLTSVAALLLDFDGPICDLFAVLPAAAVAQRLKQLAASFSATVAPDGPGEHVGPIGVLRRTAAAGDITSWTLIADALRDAEVEATSSAIPTPAAHDAIVAAWSTGRKVAIVSNNAFEAVTTYLSVHRLERYISYIAARRDGLHPNLLKPNSHLIHQALTALRVTPDLAMFIGDAVDDVRAGRAAGVSVTGCTGDPDKSSAMLAAGAEAVLLTVQPPHCVA